MNKLKPSEGNTAFCIVPWTHTYISPQSERRLCCSSREKASMTSNGIDSQFASPMADYDPITLEQHWNSPSMKSYRLKLLAGEKIPECEVCNHKVNNIHVYKDHFNQIFAHKIDECFELTESDGSTIMRPVSYDYRVTNLCNLKCRMCGDQYSSAWEQENRSLGYYETRGQKWNQVEVKEKIESFQKEIAERELWDACVENRIEEIYWVGGEPTIWEIHWDVMNYLVKTGQAEKVKIRYNTNLTRVNHKGRNLVDLLEKFRNVQVGASIDGTGEIVEYVRHGIKWEAWLANFKSCMRLNEKYGNFGLYFDVTVTSMGLFSMKSLFDLAYELKVRAVLKLALHWDSTVVMSPLMIPKPILVTIVDDILDYIRPRATADHMFINWIESLEDLKSRATFEEIYPDHIQGLAQGKKDLRGVDKARGDLGKVEKIFAQNEALSVWWDGIEKRAEIRIAGLGLVRSTFVLVTPLFKKMYSRFWRFLAQIGIDGFIKFCFLKSFKRLHAVIVKLFS